MKEKTFVLFSIIKNGKRHSFDPSFCGIFNNIEEAKKAESLLVLNGNYIPFILEQEIHSSSEEWIKSVSSIIKQKITNNVEKQHILKKENKIIQSSIIIEEKINRKKVVRQ